MPALDGRHALVSGGSRGIGAAIARRLAREGARVTVLGRDRERLAALAEELRGSWVQADVTDAERVREAVARAVEFAGPVDVLVANAGAAESAPFARIDARHWRRMLDVNLTGVFNSFAAVLPAMIERRFGRLVAVASTAGLKGYPYVAAYCAAKHGVVGLVRALALETARHGVTVNAVCPGFTETDLLASSIANIAAKTGRSEAEARAELARANPMGRFVMPEEVANAVAWLVLPGSEAVTGQAVAVAGGEVT